MDKADICTILEQIDPDTDYRESGDTYLSVRCLFKANHRHDDKTSSATISINPGGPSRYHCFGCGISGDFTSVLRKYSGYLQITSGSIINIDQILEWVKDRENMPTIRKDTLGSKPIEYPDYTAYFKALKKPGKKVRKFLNKKGVKGEQQINLFREHNKLQLAIPYFRKGRCVGMRMRNIYDHSRSKYFMIRGLSFPSREIFWGEWLYLRHHPDVLFIVEGELDAAYIMQYGMKAVAVGGSGWNMRKQDNLLFNIKPKAVIIAFDNDKAGKKGAKKISSSLSDYIIVDTFLLDNLRKTPKRRLHGEEEKIARHIL